MIKSKIQNKIMRLFTRFKFSRKLAISLRKNNPNIYRVENNSFALNVSDYADEINQKGFSSTFKIPKESLNELINYCSNSEFQGQNSKKKIKIDYKNPILPAGEKDLWLLNTKIYKECKEAYKLSHNKDLVDIAALYLEKEPKIESVHAWWSFPPKDKNYVHNYGFHYDIDSYKFVKFFIYLTDVDENSGPHVIIANTHKKKTWFQKMNRRLSDSQAQEKFNSKDINVMLGKAGEGFFEDTFSYHKGTTPQKPRLIFQVEYSI